MCVSSIPSADPVFREVLLEKTASEMVRQLDIVSFDLRRPRISFSRRCASLSPAMPTPSYDFHRPTFNASESAHICVDWDTSMKSIAGRVIGEDGIRRLSKSLMHVT